MSVHKIPQTCVDTTKKDYGKFLVRIWRSGFYCPNPSIWINLKQIRENIEVIMSVCNQKWIPIPDIIYDMKEDIPHDRAEKLAFNQRLQKIHDELFRNN